VEYAAQHRKKRQRRSDWLWAYVMIAPTVLGLAYFYFWPIVQTIYFSFTKWGAFGKYKWAGLANYEKLLADPTVWKSLGNTLVYTFLSVPVSMAISILVAVLLNQKIRGVSVYRTLYFLPVVTMPTAVAMVWKWLYHSEYGLINNLLSFFSIEGPLWINDPDIALYSLVIVAIWSTVGYNMVIFLSGLQGIPRTYYEAAQIDGAGPYRQFFRITLPLLTPTIFFVMIISMINAFQVFDIILMMIGPQNSTIDDTQSLVYLFYHHAFVIDNKGYAAAIGVILLVIILAVTIVQMRLQKKWVHYE